MKIDLNKVLITGGDGMVGSYVDFGIKTNRSILDITSLSSVLEFFKKNKPQAVLHLAALTDMNKCEEDPREAYLVNSVGTYNLAMCAKEIGTKMVYVSTDAVFPNSDSAHSLGDKEGPESVYGHSKYLGELAVKSISNDFIIARTSWVFGGGKEKDKKFVGKFIPQLDNDEAKAVNDQFNTPTYAKDLVSAIKNLILEEKSGVFHISNSGKASRFDMAKEISNFFGKKINIVPVSNEVFGLKNFQKSSGGIVGDLGLRTWQEALLDYLKTEW